MPPLETPPTSLDTIIIEDPTFYSLPRAVPDTMGGEGDAALSLSSSVKNASTLKHNQ